MQRMMILKIGVRIISDETATPKMLIKWHFRRFIYYSNSIVPGDSIFAHHFS